jgi:3-hydroxyacyl-[acyl-carrier-protein] dehydratase
MSAQRRADISQPRFSEKLGAPLMRWFWIDRFLEFESGRRAVAIKNVSYAEEQIPEYAFTAPIMPASLIIEGVAQTGGLLVGEGNGFRERVVLAKLAKAAFHDYASPGDTLRYTATLLDLKPGGAFVEGRVHVGERLFAEIDVFFAHLDDRFAGVELFDPSMFLGILRSYGLYDVGRTAEGERLMPPQHLLDAENEFYRDE